MFFFKHLREVAKINKNVTDTFRDSQGVPTDWGEGGRAGISKNVTHTFS